MKLSGKYVSCMNCGEQFYVHPHRTKTAKFCSRRCRTQHQTIVLVCEFCGKKFTRPRSNLVNRRKVGVYEHSFCSNECYGKWQRLPKEELENHRKEREEWQNDRTRFSGMRQVALKRDSFRCQACLSKDNLVVHHKDGNGYKNTDKPNNKLDNLITLCGTCHNAIHKAQKHT